MQKLTYAQAVTYKAVVAIESLRLPTIQSNPKTLAEFLSGKSEKPNYDVFATHKELFGCLPKANIITLISSCSFLVEMGYLSKASADGNIYYHTTDKNPFFTGEVPFSEKISAKNKELLNSIRLFVKNYCPPLRENDEPGYFGFKFDNFPGQKNYNWFWITKGVYQI